MRPRSTSTPARPQLTRGIPTLVRAGELKADIGMLSTPTTLISSGTATPRWRRRDQRRGRGQHPDVGLELTGPDQRRDPPRQLRARWCRRAPRPHPRPVRARDPSSRPVVPARGARVHRSSSGRERPAKHGLSVTCAASGPGNGAQTQPERRLSMRISRPLQLVAGVAALGVVLAACSAPNSGATAKTADSAATGSASDVPDKPSAPVSLHILDVAGNQKLTGPMVDEFVKAHPDIISSVTWESAGAPDLVGTIKPQVDSKSLSVDLVMTGTDGLSAGVGQNL